MDQMRERFLFLAIVFRRGAGHLGAHSQNSHLVGVLLLFGVLGFAVSPIPAGNQLPTVVIWLLTLSLVTIEGTFPA